MLFLNMSVYHAAGAVYLDIGAESYTSTARPLRFAVTSSLLPKFPPKSAQQQVVGSASVAFALEVIQQQGSAERVNPRW